MPRVATIIIAVARVAAADWHGRPAVDRVVAAARSWPTDLTLVVLAEEAAEPLLDVVDFGESLVVVDPEADEGLSSPLRVALDTLTREGDFDAAIVTYVNTPIVDPEVPAALVAEFDRVRALAVVPKYRYAAGTPVLVAEGLWGRLMGLEGDSTVLAVLGAHPEWVTEVWFDHLSPPKVESAEDLSRVKLP